MVHSSVLDVNSISPHLPFSSTDPRQEPSAFKVSYNYTAHICVTHLTILILETLSTSAKTLCHVNMDNCGLLYATYYSTEWNFLDEISVSPPPQPVFEKPLAVAEEMGE